MKKLLTILLVSLSLTTHAQFKWPDIQTVGTAATLKETYQTLPKVSESPYQFHARIILEGRFIDFYKNGNEPFEGRILNYYQQEESTVYYYRSVMLPANTCLKITEQYLTAGIPIFLTDTANYIWNQIAFDYGGGTIQSNWNGFYKQQTYSCPWLQSNRTPYLDSVTNLFDTLDEIPFFEESRQTLFDSLPGGKNYTYDGFMTTYKFTKREAKQWAKFKPRRDYFATIADSVHLYLLGQIRSRQIKPTEDFGYNSYFANYSKSGRLKKVRLSKEDHYGMFEDGLFFWREERRQARKGKRFIKKNMGPIRLKKFSLKYPITLEYSIIGDLLSVY